MKIYRVIINNFRVIKFIDFKPSQLNLILGGNNSGKTSIFQALDFALNPYKNWYREIINDYDFYNKETERKGILSDGKECVGINVEIWLTDFVDEDLEQDDWDLYIEHINKEDKIINSEEFDEKEGVKKIIRVTAECNSEYKPKFYFTKPDVKRDFRRADKERIGFHFIPAFRNPLHELSFYQNSFLSKLLETEELKVEIEHVIEDIGKSQIKLFENKDFKGNFEKLKNSIQEIELISPEIDAMTLEPLNISERKTLQNFGLVMRPKGNEKPVPLKYQGLGAQNAILILAILQTINKKSGQNLILCFEEPEQNLEFFYQRLLAKKLMKSSKIDYQLFITSYSPDIIKSFKMSDTYLIKKDNNSHKLLSLSESPQAPLKWKKFLNRLENKNKDEVLKGIFSKYVLLVEGESEGGGLPVFSKYSKKGLEDVGVEIVLAYSFGEISKYAKYFKDLDIPVISLCDKSCKTSSSTEINNIAKNSDLTIIWINYENALLEKSELSQLEKFTEVCAIEYDYNENKDIFLENTFTSNESAPELKNFFLTNKDSLYKCKDLKSLLDILQKNKLLKNYQEIFLHRSLSSIRLARLVAEYLCEERDENIPPLIKSLFELIVFLIGNNFSVEDDKAIIVENKELAQVKNKENAILELSDG